MSTTMIVLIVVIAIIVILGIYLIAARNKLVVLKNRVKDQWAQIDVQLKRRFDLIPNLVETVKGYAKHEKETLEEVINARNEYLKAGNNKEAIKANDDLLQGISKLFALAESYPDLKANTNFVSMQQELQNTEDKIAAARQFYNDVVLQYNNQIELFPSNIVASIFKFKTESYFEALSQEKENVTVKF